MLVVVVVVVKAEVFFSDRSEVFGGSREIKNFLPGSSSTRNYYAVVVFFLQEKCREQRLEGGKGPLYSARKRSKPRTRNSNSNFDPRGNR